jgi:cytoskeletal protein RodZ
MRNLAVLIVIGAVGYYGWQAYQKNPEAFTKYLPKQETEETASAESSDAATAATPPAGAVPAPAATPPPPPVFTSRIKVDAATAGEGEKKTLPPGQFLIVERASVETKDGISAVVPGDMVKLIERRGNGTLLVTNGQHDFTVKESQVTQDVAIAQEAERREFQKRYGAIR